MVKPWRPLIVGVLTFAAAVSFRSDFLLFLFGFELMLYIAAWIQVRWIAKKVRMQIHIPQSVAFRGKPFELRTGLTNTGFFPVPRLMARAAVRAYPEREELLLVGKTMLDSHEKGSICFSLDSTHCGCMEIRCDRLLVTDYLGMVQHRCAIDRKEKHCLYILPELLCETPEVLPEQGTFLAEEGESSRSGSSSPDSSNIREYHPGEPLRHIHWKLSARMQRLLIRELTDREQERTWIYLNLLEPTGSNLRRDPNAWDHFIETTALVSQALLQMEVPHLVVWIDAAARKTISYEVSDPRTLQQMLCALLHSDSFKGSDYSHLLKEIHSHEAKQTRIEIDLQGNIRRSEAEG